MTTEQQTTPSVVLSTAMLGRLEDAVGSYWDCAYQEGHLNRPDGDKANAILHEIRCAAQAMVEAEIEACELRYTDWIAEGEIISGRKNLGAIFALGAWWADRPWRKRSSAELCGGTSATNAGLHSSPSPEKDQ